MKYLRILFLAISISSVSLSHAFAIDCNYSIAISKTQPQIVSVTAQFVLKDSMLYMSENGPVPERWPQYIHALNARDAKGNPVPVTDIDSTAWYIPSEYIGKPIEINYKLHIEHENQSWPGGIDGVAFTRPYGVMMTGRSLFIMNGKDRKDIEVQFELPEDWAITTPWNNSTSDESKYTVENLEQLQESYLFAGHFKEVILSRDDFDLIFVLCGNDIRSKANDYQKMASSVLDYYIDLMGGIPTGSPDNKFTRAMVMIHASDDIDGEVIGNHINILINPSAPPHEQMIAHFLFAHEFFHLWNGKTIRFSTTDTDWFKEGVTNYYTLKALHQTGYADENAVLSILQNLFYGRYANDPGLGNIPISEAASAMMKDDHWGLVYGGGLFAGIAIDFDIRKRSQHGRGMDNVMKQLYTRYGNANKTVDNDVLLSFFNDVGNTDYTDFFDAYIYGMEVYPLLNKWETAGIKAENTDQGIQLEKMDNTTSSQKQLWNGFLGNP